MEIKMIKILKSFVVIVAVAAVAVGATGAYFSDTETVAGNSFTAGSLDLQLGAGNPIPFNLSDVLPGDSGTGKVTLTNATGSVPADLDIDLADVVQSENGIVPPELAAGDYENGGDLWISYGMAAYLDVNQDGVFNAGDIQLTYNGQKSAYPGFWGGSFNYHGIGTNGTSNMSAGWNDIMTLNGGDSVDLVLMWRVNPVWDYPNYNQNIIMTDTLGFSVKSSLEQVGAPGGVVE
jgi:predicted ribosomally synthesized peptide with SipW-like signal peptide